MRVEQARGRMMKRMHRIEVDESIPMKLYLFRQVFRGRVHERPANSIDDGNQFLRKRLGKRLPYTVAVYDFKFIGASDESMR